ncbi:hypothetical protein RND81_12G028300 [Saponaria officinalis]|uniref:Uncharacterized protein n=1 Tax=Saponaria officinalis TaxID=3572 RepID=A0AAW1H764_SAPOF
MFVLPFAAFQLLDIYWKCEHRLMCISEICTAAERDRYEKAVLFLHNCNDSSGKLLFEIGAQYRHLKYDHSFWWEKYEISAGEGFVCGNCEEVQPGLGKAGVIHETTYAFTK